MKPPEGDDYEVFDGPGFIMERRGRFISTKSTLGPSEHAEMRRRMGESAPGIECEMRERVAALYEILHKYDPEAMIGAVAFRNTLISSAKGRLDERGRQHAIVDYVTTLYVRDAGDGTECVVPPVVLEDVQSRVKSLFASSHWLWMARDAGRGDDKRDDNLEHLRYRTYMDSLVVRYPGHVCHLVAVLEGLHSAMRQDLADHLGWNVQDATRIAQAALRLCEDRLNDSLAAAHAAMRDKDVDSMEGEEKQKWLYGVSAWVQFRMQFSLAFSPDELARASSVAVDRVTAFLEAACLPWGSCTDELYLLPHATPLIQRKPVLKLEDDRYLVALPGSLIWAVRPVVEDALKADASGEGKAWWDRYEKARAEFTESLAVALLGKAMPHAGRFHSLKYPWDENGQAMQAELDGLIIADDIALLIEVKAGEMSPAGRRGAPSGMKEDLEGLVGEAHRQALRARRYCKSADKVTFSLSDGSTLVVDSGRLDDFIMITVTLDALDIFTSALYRLAGLGVLRDHDLPWAVSLCDLMCISEAVEFPAQLIHFLRRRARLNELAFVMAHDELDWFGHYLSEGLWFEHLAQKIGGEQIRLNIIGYSADLDAHFMAVGHEGEEVPPPMPRQAMPSQMRMLLRELEESQPHGYLHISLALLDLSIETRTQFFEAVERTVQLTLGDGERHDFTMILDGGHGGLHFSAATDRVDLQKHLLGYGQLKMYQSRCSEWVGIGRLVPSEHLLDEAIYMRKPWEFDEELERLVDEYLQPLPERNQRSPDGASADELGGTHDV